MLDTHNRGSLWNKTRQRLDIQVATSELAEFLNRDKFVSQEEPILEMGDWPRLSVIVPSFNQGRYLERTILSILNQAYPNLELIVIDGGSTDSSLNVLQQYDQFIAHWVSEKDNGQAHAINKGMAISTGEWLSFQNSDDLYLPGALRSVGLAVKANPNSDVIIGHVVGMNQGDEVTGAMLVMPPSFWRQISVGILFHNQATFWRRSITKRLGEFREDLRFALDYEYFTRILQNNFKVTLLDRYLGAFRYHPMSKSSTISHIGMSEHKAVVKGIQNNLRGNYRAFLPAIMGKAVKAIWCLLTGRGWYLFRQR